MSTKKFFSFLLIATLAVAGFFCFTAFSQKDDERILSYTVDPASQHLKLYWKDDKGAPLKSILNLKTYLEQKDEQLVFAMNAGMYMTDNSPLGLFIQDQKTITRLNTADGSGNFYMKPNGIFYLTTDKKAFVCRTEDFAASDNIRYATQSGPMLVVDGKIHPAFKEGSANLNIRNGVGILPDGKVLFAMSKKEINFYDFASWFKSQGVKNALYLDGFVSRTYLPEKKWIQTDGNFGVMIGVSVPGKKSKGK